MNRIILSLALGLAVVAPLGAAHADPPSQADLEAAKKAFEAGKALHDAGNLAGAIDKFKESYRLSKNPLLLYNIGFTMDEAGKADEALLYYNKFLSDAPAGAPQRAQVQDRVKTLEKQRLDADLNGTSTSSTTTTTTQPTSETPTKIKPAGTYGAKDFQHQTVDEAPPGKPLDISAYVPPDSGFKVTLFFRGSGEATFTAKPMKWHYHELVARIPAAKMQGNSIQYYIEVKDASGNEVTRSGKATSPNLVNIDPGATAKFYPDLQDDGSEMSMTDIAHHDNEDNPLGNSQDNHQQPDQPNSVVAPTEPEHPLPPGVGFRDVGSKKFEYAKWGTTGGAVAFVGLGIAFSAMAHSQASSLQFDATHDDNGNTCTAPCRPFDSYDKSLQDAGHRDQTISDITFGVGVAAAVVAGYFWYRELTHKKHGEVGMAKHADPDEAWLIAPSVGAGYTGAAAAVRF